ncbi:MAG: hypothetical protein WBG71_04735 [Leeuwenhoekiella sp.]
MVIERTNDEIILRLSGDIDENILQRIVKFVKYKETIKESQATEEQAQDLARESKAAWWSANKERFIK